MSLIYKPFQNQGVNCRYFEVINLKSSKYILLEMITIFQIKLELIEELFR